MYGSEDIDGRPDADSFACKHFSYYNGLHSGTGTLVMGTRTWPNIPKYDELYPRQDTTTLMKEIYSVQPPHKVGSRNLSGDEITHIVVGPYVTRTIGHELV